MRGRGYLINGDEAQPYIVCSVVATTGTAVILSFSRLRYRVARLNAVSSARLYVIVVSEGLKGLNHSLGDTKEDKCHLVEFVDPHWSNYWRLSSSHDGRYISFSHLCKALLNREG